MMLTPPDVEAEKAETITIKQLPDQHEQSRLMDPENELPRPEIIVIRTPKQAETLLINSSFHRLKGVSYVASLSLIKELFDNGYQEVELVVGLDFGESYLKELKGQDIETTRYLAQLVVDGMLRLYFPKKLPDHSKLYILSKPGRTRILFGSANLTENVKKARQANMMWVFDLPEKHPFVAALTAEFEREIRKHCVLFMGDLAEELKERMKNGKTEKEVIEYWLNRNPESEEDMETIAIIKDATMKALEIDRNEAPIITLDLPKSEKTDKKLKNLFEAINPDRSPEGIRINCLEWANYVREKWHVPLMTIDMENKSIRANIRGSVEVLTSELPEPIEVDMALAHVEDYINSIDMGVSSDPILAKQSIYEALLYILSSPFANERMKAIRERHGLATRRGPLILYITGPSSNGKTAFLKFALKILTGYNIEQIDGQNFFKKKQIRAIRNLQTNFPMVFDDVPASKDFENIVKPYWETEWRADMVFPQLIMTSNVESLREWAKTRIKLIRFDVHFTEKKENKDILSDLLKRENHLFQWFSYLYMEGMESEDFLFDDQLRLARVVMRQLYTYAGRQLPVFYLDSPLELICDPGKSEWMRLIQLKKVTMAESEFEVIIDFTSDLDLREIYRYEGHLPQAIKHKRTGKSLIIENPETLFSWISRDTWPKKDEASPTTMPAIKKSSFLTRLFGRTEK